VGPPDASQCEDRILANTPEFISSMADAEADLGMGRVTPIEQLLARSGSRRERVAKRP